MKASMTKGKGWRIACVAIGVTLLVGCSQKPASEQPPEPGDTSVARVDGAPIWTSDVKREAVTQGLIGQGEPLDTGSTLFRQVLEQVVDQKLLAAEAIRRRLDKGPASQRRLATVRERVLGDLLLESSIGKQVDEAAVNGLYQEMVKNETPTEAIHLRQILSANQADALEVRTLLAKGGSFDALAAERSRDDTTRFKGGELPPATMDMLPPAYAQALATAKTGQLVGPFKSEAGWVVVRVDDRHLEAPISLDVVRPQIIRYLTFDQVKDLILNLRHKAKVESLLGPAPADTPLEPASAPPPPAPAMTRDGAAKDVKK